MTKIDQKEPEHIARHCTAACAADSSGETIRLGTASIKNRTPIESEVLWQSEFLAAQNTRSYRGLNRGRGVKPGRMLWRWLSRNTELRHVCSALILSSVALLSSEFADAQFAPQKKLSKDYYVVREPSTKECTVKTGSWDKKPIGMVGDGPYASKDYAIAAMKTFPECKGTKPETGKKNRNE